MVVCKSSETRIRSVKQFRLNDEMCHVSQQQHHHQHHHTIYYKVCNNSLNPVIIYNNKTGY